MKYNKQCSPCFLVQVETWVSLSDQLSNGQIQVGKAIQMIEAQLGPKGALVGDGKKVTIADLVVWAALTAHGDDVAKSKNTQLFFNKIKNDRSFATVHSFVGKYEAAPAEKISSVNSFTTAQLRTRVSQAATS
jgi:hypothetical protein